MKSLLPCILIASVLLAVPARSAVRETTDADVERAIDRVKRFLWSRQHPDGHWQVPHYERNHHLPGGFTTAIIAYALLEGGDTPQNNPQMEKALDALMKMKANNTRFRSLRAMCLARVVAGETKDKKSKYYQQLADDLRWLLVGNGRVAFRGAWGENGPEPLGDNMSGQFALAAMWESYLAQLELKKRIFTLAQANWIKTQQKDGGWALDGDPRTSMATDVRMTAAALSCLYICRDALERGAGRYPFQRNVDRAWDYLNKNFKPDFIGNSYSAFCIQQLGMRSGRKYIGKYDWYDIALAKLAEPSPGGPSYRGYWGPLVRAAFELIFLARARIPLAVSKLEYGTDSGWNTYTRDLARFTDYARRQFERQLRWQIVKITGDIQSLLDAPVLLIEGDKEIDLSEADWAKLREYTLRGGLLVFVPVGRNRKFVESVKTALPKLYEKQRAEVPSSSPYFTLQEQGDTSAIYQGYAKVERGAAKVPAWAISDGSRMIAIVLGDDIAASWQKRDYLRDQVNHPIGLNLMMYGIGGNYNLMRMRPIFDPPTGKPRHVAKVGWLKHDGNWHTQPYALDYLSQKTQVENRVRIAHAPLEGIDAKKLNDKHLIWVTGTDRFTLSAKQIEALRAYINQGGVLFFNAIGGSRQFKRSAEDAIDKLLAGKNASQRPVSPTSPLLTGKAADFRGPKITDPKRSSAFIMAERTSPDPLTVYSVGGRPVVILGPFGIHDTMDGHVAAEAVSYLPGSARSFGANIVLYALAKPELDKKK